MIELRGASGGVLVCLDIFDRSQRRIYVEKLLKREVSARIVASELAKAKEHRCTLPTRGPNLEIAQGGMGGSARDEQR